jgi:hypothetical protein
MTGRKREDHTGKKSEAHGMRIVLALSTGKLAKAPPSR